MKRVIFSTVSALALLTGQHAVAADMAVKAPVRAAVVAPMYNWTGFYIGGVGGYGWGSDDWTRIASSNGGTIGTVRSFDTGGGVVGGQLGYNYQINQVVLGVEGGMVWSGVGGGLSGTNNNGPASWNTNTQWIASVAGRLGYAIDNVLIYAKGGVAWANDDYSHPATSGPGAGNIPLNYTANSTRTGWLVGGGVEYGFMPNWSAKLEYNYMDFGSKDITLNDPTGRWVTFGMKETVNVFEVGLNYRFGGPIVARY